MSKGNMKKVIISLVAILLLVTVACKTCAANDSVNDVLNELLQGNNTNQPAEIPSGERDNGNNNVPNETNNTNIPENNNVPTTTPYAGVGDYTGVIFIVIFTVSAVYAYTKIRKYHM